jgi:hypothetical protein
MKNAALLFIMLLRVSGITLEQLMRKEELEAVRISLMYSI